MCLEGVFEAKSGKNFRACIRPEPWERGKSHAKHRSYQISLGSERSLPWPRTISLYQWDAPHKSLVQRIYTPELAHSLLFHLHSITVHANAAFLCKYYTLLVKRSPCVPLAQLWSEPNNLASYTVFLQSYSRTHQLLSVTGRLQLLQLAGSQQARLFRAALGGSASARALVVPGW